MCYRFSEIKLPISYHRTFIQRPSQDPTTWASRVTTDSIKDGLSHQPRTASLHGPFEPRITTAAVDAVLLPPVGACFEVAELRILTALAENDRQAALDFKLKEGPGNCSRGTAGIVD